MVTSVTRVRRRTLRVPTRTDSARVMTAIGALADARTLPRRRPEWPHWNDRYLQTTDSVVVLGATDPALNRRLARKWIATGGLPGIRPGGVSRRGARPTFSWSIQPANNQRSTGGEK